MSEPKTHLIRHHHMYLPESYDFATYAMVEYYYYSDAMEENARLKAEVERLTAFTTRTIIPNEELQAQVETLQARCDFLEGRGL